jgi:hypothetical protein
MHGPKLNRDWVGLRVQLVHRAENSLGTIAGGTTGTITSYDSGHMRIRFEATPCEKCQCAFAVAGMYRRDFVILTPRGKWKNTQGKGRGRHARPGVPS